MDQSTWQNVYNCSSQNIKGSLTVPNLTNVIHISGTKVETISLQFIQQIKQVGTVKVLNLTNNAIKYLPETIQELNQVQEMWLAGNPFHCDCKMSWMILWLSNSSRHNLVKDITDMRCYNGSKFKGIPIQLLSDVLLGCYPSRWTIGQKVAVVCSLAVIIVLFVLTIIGFKRSREVKFLMYYYLRLNTMPRDEKNEKLDHIEHDAFLCFW